MLTKNQIIIIGVVAFIILFFILGLLGVIPIFKNTNPGQNPNTEATLNFWGVDDSNSYRSVFDAYASSHPGIKISYQQFDEKNYESALLNALATGKGPDVFMFHRTWLPKHGDKVIAASDAQFSLFNMRQLFPDVVEKDFVSNQKVYALPLYLDSLALFYNKDIFNAKGIALAPATWDEFKNLVPFLTEFDFSRNIKKSAAAIGGTNKSIDNASDLLALLMLQNNPQFTDYSNKRLIFDDKALGAFNFYLQFGNPSSDYYTWSDTFGNSINAFASGDVPMIFNYARKTKTIRQKNPYLNFSVAAMPQFDLNNPANFADYWGLAVSKQTKMPQTAWGFVISLTTNQQISSAYLKDSNSPPALRTLINQNLSDPNIGVFAKQALTVKSIYQQNKETFAQSFSYMIESVLTGRLSSGDAMRKAAIEINGL